jgi:hypothetical protein
MFGTWTFTPTGAKPNGTNAYMDTSFVPSNNISINSGHLSYYSRTNVNLSQIEMGTITGASAGYYLIFSFGGTGYSAINSIESPRPSAANPTTGLLIGSRTTSTEEKYFTNGVSQTRTANVSSVPNYSVYIGCYSQYGNPAYYSTKQCAFASVGDGLLDSEAAALYTIVQQFQTSMARQV